MLIKPVVAAMLTSAMLMAGAEAKAASVAEIKTVGAVNKQEEEGGISALVLMLAGSAAGVYLVNRRQSGRPKKSKKAIAKAKAKNKLKKKDKANTESGGMAPGWYADSQDSDQLRWFDGKKWDGRTYSRARAEKAVEEKKEDKEPERSMESA